MQLKIGYCVLAFKRGIADRVDRNTALLERIFKARAAGVRANAILLDGLRACECRRSKQAAAKASAFFIGPVDQAHGHGRLAVILLRDPAHNSVGGEDAEAAIEPATVGDGVKMAAENQAFF